MMTEKTKNIILGLSVFISLTNQEVKPKINFSGAQSSLIFTGSSGKLLLDTSLTDVPGIIMITENKETGISKTSTSHELTFMAPGQLIYGSSTSNNEFTGTIDSETNTLSLSGGGQTLAYSGQIITSNISISGDGNKISGTPIFTKPIVLQDTSTTVTLALDTKLTGSIQMNGGSVFLERDLSLKDDVHITGSGTINFNGWSFEYPVYTQPITSELNMINANDIGINTRIWQTSNTNFWGTNNIRGRGTIVDFTGGGSFTFKNNSTTYMNAVHIKGLGSNGGGNLILQSNAKVYLTNCILDLDGDYTQTNGEMIVDGGNCKIISNPTSDYIVSGASTILKIDRQMLEYENSGESPRYPIQTTSGGTVTKINGGRISSNFIPGPGQETDFSAAGTNSLNSDLNLDGEAIVTFVNATPGTPKAMTLNGNFNTVRFSNAATTPIVVETNVTLTLNDVKLQNFDPERFDLQGSGGTLAKVEFGNNVTLEIEKDLSLASGSINFSGSGTSTLTCNNSTITAASGAIKVTGTGQLNIKNSKIIASATDSLKSTSNTGTIKLQASELIMKNVGITWGTGNLKISDHVSIRGASETMPEATVSFNLTTAGNLTIESDSILEMLHDTQLLYDPDTTGDNASEKKRHITFTDPSSILAMQKATLNAGTPGLAIDHGRILINDACKCKTGYAVGKEFEIGSAANFTIANSGAFSVDGAIKYTATTFP